MGVPETAKSLALILEDPDAEQPNPFVHWLIPVAPCVDAAPRARLQV